MQCIANSQSGQAFALEEDGVTLKPAQQMDQKAHAVVEETLRQAALAEETKDRVWIKCDDGEYSLGHFLNTRPDLSKPIEDLKEGLKDEPRVTVKVSHENKQFDVDLHRLRCFSTLMNTLVRDVEDVEDVEDIGEGTVLTWFVNVKTEYVEAVINVINKGSLEDNLDFEKLCAMLTVAMYIDSEEIRELCAKAISTLPLTCDGKPSSDTNIQTLEGLSYEAVLVALKYCEGYQISSYLMATIEKQGDEKQGDEKQGNRATEFRSIAASFVNTGKLSVNHFAGIDKFLQCVNPIEVKDVSMTLPVEKEGLEGFFAKCSNVETFSTPPCLTSCSFLKFCPNLKKLVMQGQRYLKGDELRYLEHVPNLEVLDIYRCAHLSKDSLKFLKYVPNLKFLRIGGCELDTETYQDFLAGITVDNRTGSSSW